MRDIIMVERDITDNYEELLNYTEEVRNSLDIIHDWLMKKPRMLWNML